MKKEYAKILKIKKLSNIVGCITNFTPQKIELLLLVVHFVIIILSLMNFFIMPWTKLDKALFGLRIAILSSLAISIICLIYNQIFRKGKKIFYGIYYCISFFGTILSLGLNILNFLCIFISCLVIIDKLNKNRQATYNYKSILVIDIFSILIVFGMFFLWYAEFIIIYAKANDNLKDFIEDKMRLYERQNTKIVNVELSNDFKFQRNRNYKNYIKNKERSVDEDTISSNKEELSHEKHENEEIKKTRKNNSEVSSADTK